VAHGLRRWRLGVVHLWLSILCWLGELLGELHAFLRAAQGIFFMKELVLSCVYTRFDLWGFVAMISSRGAEQLNLALSSIFYGKHIVLRAALVKYRIFTLPLPITLHVFFQMPGISVGGPR
jgi:hypothetical protein